MKVRDLVEIKDSGIRGRLIRYVRFPASTNFNRFKWRIHTDDGHEWHKEQHELTLIEAAPKQAQENNQLELW